MQEKLKGLATFTVTIGGLSVEMKRRCTAVMLEMGGVRQVLGLLPGALKDEAHPDRDPDSPEAVAQRVSNYAELLDKFGDTVVVSVDGVPWQDTGLGRSDLAPLLDGLFKEFLNSGLDVDPMPESSGVGKDS